MALAKLGTAAGNRAATAARGCAGTGWGAAVIGEADTALAGAQCRYSDTSALRQMEAKLLKELNSKPKVMARVLMMSVEGRFLTWRISVR